ncbi:MAG: prepilin-type N-terminal cleavage/methylation domain-containing protein [Bacilli bacterium]
MNFKAKLTKGFTLIELVVTLGVSTIMMGIITAFVVLVAQNSVYFHNTVSTLYDANNISIVIQNHVNKIRSVEGNSIVFFEADSSKYKVDPQFETSPELFPQGFSKTSKKLTCLYAYDNTNKQGSVWYGQYDADINGKPFLFYLDYSLGNIPMQMYDKTDVVITSTNLKKNASTSLFQCFSIKYEEYKKNLNFTITI